MNGKERSWGAMSKVENRVGVSAGGWYPYSSLMPPRAVAKMAARVGAEVVELFPGWVDGLLPEGAYQGLAVPVGYVHQSWWADRVVEGVQRFPKEPGLRRWERVYRLGFPPSGVCWRTVERVLGANPEAFMVTHWPYLPREKIVDAWRAELVEERARRMGAMPERVVAEVHSPHILLTPDELQEWREGDPENRRLGVVYPVDPRRGQHAIAESLQAELVNPLKPWVSVVYLKIGDLLDERGEVLMVEEEVVRAIEVNDWECAYGQRLTRLSEEVGGELGGVDWMINTRFGLGATFGEREEFLREFVGYVRGVVN